MSSAFTADGDDEPENCQLTSWQVLTFHSYWQHITQSKGTWTRLKSLQKSHLTSSLLPILSSFLKRTFAGLGQKQERKHFSCSLTHCDRLRVTQFFLGLLKQSFTYHCKIRLIQIILLTWFKPVTQTPVNMALEWGCWEHHGLGTSYTILH